MPVQQARLDLGRRTAALKIHLEAMPGAAAHPMAASRGTTPLVLLYKSRGKMFAILSVKGTKTVILNCDPHLADALRKQYADIGHRSHLDKRFGISVNLDGDVPAKEVRRLAAHSYEQARARLTRKQQAELEAL